MHGLKHDVQARIISAGGTVAEFGGFERVVAPDQNTVLAPTRSIGGERREALSSEPSSDSPADVEFDPVGVIPTPEVQLIITPMCRRARADASWVPGG